MDIDVTAADTRALGDRDSSRGTALVGDVLGDGAGEELFPGLFRKLPPPLLDTPVAPPPPLPARARKERREVTATRSSSRLAAKDSSIPVAQRAQNKLMKELSFIDGSQQEASDEAVTEYLDLYAADLPEKAMRAIQVAAKLGNKKLVEILEAVVQEASTLEMKA